MVLCGPWASRQAWHRSQTTRERSLPDLKLDKSPNLKVSQYVIRLFHAYSAIAIFNHLFTGHIEVRVSSVPYSGENMRNSAALMPYNTLSAVQAVPAPSSVKERRLQKRHTSSRMKLTFLGVEHKPLNWSLGGVLVADSLPRASIGTTADGFIEVIGRPGRIAIRVELARRDKRTKEIAFRFIDPSPALLNALLEE